MFSHLTWQFVGRRMENPSQRASAQEIGEKGLPGGMEVLAEPMQPMENFFKEMGIGLHSAGQS